MRFAAFIISLSVAACLCSAQTHGLYSPTAEQNEPGAVQPLQLAEVSQLYIEPPEPHVMQKHDLVTIIIDESSTTTSSQELETTKEYETDATINSVLDPWHLLELRLREGNLSDVDLIRAGMEREFTGEGEYGRRDRFSARITATVLEVKPNGTLLIEARKHIEKDDEIQDLVLSGYCRQEDVTRQNTVLSSQIASLRIVMENQGEVHEAAQKGLLSRILDTVFAF